MASTKIIVFDLDGVLIDSEEANYQAFAYGIEQLGLPKPDRQTLISLVGLKASLMLEKLGCPAEEGARIFRDFVQPFYIENLPRLAAPMPQAATVLQSLKQRGYRILACTSGDRRTQTAALKGVGLWSAIEGMHAADDSQFAKPDPRYLQELLAPYDYQTLLHVEDAEVGIRMGQACGAVSIFAEYGYGSLPADLPVDYRLTQLADILAIAT
ncbi:MULTISPECIES: HAD family hydrolase [unclassified Synechocystis]|uniref:HAD family hydrolase n=1 Tax=unclassified Synechocystis TaxID=2640012 RepID=UPI0003FD8ED9|nr:MULTISPECIES: HAD family hydrolase [unclassified Synechocystis]AIE72930.1 Phosphoglycolate phosphatase [Synechocystis sp. PCC 6714]MCT0252593.1 HAD family hydrolase [Synechocystis sp. CS-94]